MKQKNGEPAIYVLPNLMTAGNLFCGFAAVLSIIEASLAKDSGQPIAPLYHQAIAFILAACIFDILDGRLARFGGNESTFGKEFDSLADVISFGLAPSLLAYQIVLKDFAKTGWLIAFIYLLCGALRLARFNCSKDPPENSTTPAHDFIGFPIPAAAGLIASLTLFLLWLDEGAREIGPWKFALPPLLLFLSFMMFSKVRYPSFKSISWNTKRPIPKFIATIITLALCAMHYEWMPALAFLAFLLYGFVRPFLARSLRREIEDEDEDSPPTPNPLP